MKNNNYDKTLDFSCFVLGTTLKHREQKMLETLISIDVNNFNFIDKILSIDDFGEGTSINVEEYCRNNNWEILIDEKKGMVNNQIKALKKIKTEWVLYCEDDVIVEKLPNIEQIKKLLEKKNNVGIISMTGGGYDSHNNHDEIRKNLINDIVKVDGDIFWYRDPLLRNDWFFEFPTMIVKTQIFKDCIDTSLKIFKNIQIEQSYTKSYFHLNYHTKYDRYTWSRDFTEKLDYSKNIEYLLSEICENYIYIKHNRNEHLPSVGSGYFVN